MIELNLTYEESKKILELGYDFSPVCDRFVQELAKLKEPEYIEQEQFLVTIFRTETNQRMSNSLTPIVPKAVLEACLPDIVDAYHGDLAWYIPRNPLEYRLCRDGDLVTSLLLEEFDSAYEAFIWCHEHHPEELRKKFKEVMG